MGTQFVNYNLLETTSQAFTALGTSSASGGTFGRVINANHFSQFNLFVTSTVSGTDNNDTYFRPEIWHTYAPDQWYLHSTIPAQQNAHNSYSLVNFGPYVRLKWIVSTTNSSHLPSANPTIPLAGTSNATVRVYLSAKYDF